MLINLLSLFKSDFPIWPVNLHYYYWSDNKKSCGFFKHISCKMKRQMTASSKNVKRNQLIQSVMLGRNSELWSPSGTCKGSAKFGKMVKKTGNFNTSLFIHASAQQIHSQCFFCHFASFTFLPHQSPPLYASVQSG